MKKNELDIDAGSNGKPDDFEEGDAVLDKARSEVLNTLSEKKKREQKEKLWRDRPKHLRKALGDMSPKEKNEYYLWKAREFESKSAPAPAALEPEKEEEPEITLYNENEVKRVGKMFLRFIARRLPVKKDVSQEEIDTFGECFTPLANKYMGRMGYKNEVAAGVFVLSFVFDRVGKDDSEPTQ